MRKTWIILIFLAALILFVIYAVLMLERRVTTDSSGNVVADSNQNFAKVKQNTDQDNMVDDGKVLVTGNIRHTVPLDKIVAGGPPKDGIPPIDDPHFETVSEADEYLDPNGLGIAVSFNGIDRFYPFQILVWHEIVNDNLGDQPVLITYCPLCGTGIVFDPQVGGEHTTFGTSGKLYQSNLVMYDRLTDTYWSQVLGEAIVGKHAGERLALLPYQNITWADWKVMAPNGEVLSRDTGASRDYTTSPYGDYASNTSVYFPVDNTDDRFHPKEPVWGLEVRDIVKAFPQIELEKSPGKFTTTVGDVQVLVDFDKDNKTVMFRDQASDNELVPVYGFWFSWISVHPDTEVYLARG